MTKKEYLYGKHKAPDVPEEVIDTKCKALSAHLDELLEVELKKRDIVRIHKVMNAIDFWENINEK